MVCGLFEERTTAILSGTLIGVEIKVDYCYQSRFIMRTAIIEHDFFRQYNYRTRKHHNREPSKAASKNILKL